MSRRLSLIIISWWLLLLIATATLRPLNLFLSQIADGSEQNDKIAKKTADDENLTALLEEELFQKDAFDD